MTGAAFGLTDHQVREAERGNLRVSSQSLWNDVVWYIDNFTPGMHLAQTAVNWDIEVADKETLLTPKHTLLLTTMRLLIWNLVHDRRDGPNLKAISISHLRPTLKFVCRWMVRHGINHLGNLSAEACSLLLADLIEEYDEQNKSTGARSYAHRATTFLYYLYGQRDAFEAAGLPCMPEPPFSATKASEVTEALFPKQRDTACVTAIPTAVALPVLAAAHRLLGGPAEDVIALQKRYLKFASILESASIPGERKRKPLPLLDFSFKTLPGESAPWHLPIQALNERQSIHHHHAARWTPVTVRPSPLVVRLVVEVMTAAAIVIQGGTGLRVTELLGLEDGLEAASGWPRCIKVVPSRTGQNEIFYLTGRMYKTVRKWEQVEWVCGWRPKGTDVLPPVVQAVMVLSRLTEPYRRQTGSTLLFTYPQAMKGQEITTTTVSTLKLNNLRYYVQSFISQHVDLDWKNLPNEPGMQRFRLLGAAAFWPRQWRKTSLGYKSGKELDKARPRRSLSKSQIPQCPL